MLPLAELFMDLAEASSHVYFIYNLTAPRVTVGNAAYEQAFGGRRSRVNEELPALVARLHPDDARVRRHWWRLWGQGQLHNEVKFRRAELGQPVRWFCLTPHCYRDAAGTV